MLLLIIGLALFLGIHTVPMAAGLRNRMVDRVGLWPWKGIFSLFAIAGLALIIIGYGLARQDPIILWHPPVFLRHLAALLLIPVFPLLLATYFPGRIKAKIKNPMLVAVKAWALAHLLVNGALADVLLFGSFLIWAVVDGVSVKRRGPSGNPALPARPLNDVVAVVVGLILYVVFVVWAHEWLIGLPPFAM